MSALQYFKENIVIVCNIDGIVVIQYSEVLLNSFQRHLIEMADYVYLLKGKSN